MKLSCVFPILLALLLPLTAKAADPPADALSRAKMATALLVSPTPTGEAMVGTAFCINTHRQFVTCAHILQGQFAMGAVQLILDTKDDGRVVAHGHLQVIDRKADIALLQLDTLIDVTPIPIAYRADLKTKSPVYGLGYFDPPVPVLGDGGFQPITQISGKITGLPSDKGFLIQIQCDAQFKPGFDGGPLLNEKGEVIGILQGQSKNEHVSLALPGDFIRDYFFATKLDCKPVEFPQDALDQPVEISADLVNDVSAAPFAVVAFRVNLENGKQRTYSGHTTDGKHYTALIKPSDVGNMHWIRTAAVFTVTATRNGSRVAQGLANIRIAKDRPAPSPHP